MADYFSGLRAINREIGQPTFVELISARTENINAFRSANPDVQLSWPHLLAGNQTAPVAQIEDTTPATPNVAFRAATSTAPQVVGYKLRSSQPDTGKHHTIKTDIDYQDLTSNHVLIGPQDADCYVGTNVIINGTFLTGVGFWSVAKFGGGSGGGVAHGTLTWDSINKRAVLSDPTGVFTYNGMVQRVSNLTPGNTLIFKFTLTVDSPFSGFLDYGFQVNPVPGMNNTGTNSTLRNYEFGAAGTVIIEQAFTVPWRLLQGNAADIVFLNFGGSCIIDEVTICEVGNDVCDSSSGITFNVVKNQHLTDGVRDWSGASGAFTPTNGPVWDKTCSGISLDNVAGSTIANQKITDLTPGLQTSLSFYVHKITSGSGGSLRYYVTNNSNQVLAESTIDLATLTLPEKLELPFVVPSDGTILITFRNTGSSTFTIRDIVVCDQINSCMSGFTKLALTTTQNVAWTGNMNIANGQILLQHAAGKMSKTFTNLVPAETFIVRLGTVSYHDTKLRVTLNSGSTTKTQDFTEGLIQMSITIASTGSVSVVLEELGPSLLGDRAITAILACAGTSQPVPPPPPPASPCGGGTSAVVNGSFDSGIAPWASWQPSSGSAGNGQLTWDSATQRAVLNPSTNGLASGMQQRLNNLVAGDGLALTFTITLTGPGSVEYGFRHPLGMETKIASTTDQNGTTLTLQTAIAIPYYLFSTGGSVNALDVVIVPSAGTGKAYVDNVLVCRYPNSSCATNINDAVRNGNFYKDITFWSAPGGGTPSPANSPDWYSQQDQSIVLQKNKLPEARQLVVGLPVGTTVSLTAQLFAASPNIGTIEYGVLGDGNIVISNTFVINSSTQLPQAITIPFTVPASGKITAYFKNVSLNSTIKVRNVRICTAGDGCPSGYDFVSYTNCQVDTDGWTNLGLANQLQNGAITLVDTKGITQTFSGLKAGGQLTVQLASLMNYPVNLKLESGTGSSTASLGSYDGILSGSITVATGGIVKATVYGQAGTVVDNLLVCTTGGTIIVPPPPPPTQPGLDCPSGALTTTIYSDTFDGPVLSWNQITPSASIENNKLKLMPGAYIVHSTSGATFDAILSLRFSAQFDGAGYKLSYGFVKSNGLVSTSESYTSTAAQSVNLQMLGYQADQVGGISQPYAFFKNDSSAVVYIDAMVACSTERDICGGGEVNVVQAIDISPLVVGETGGNAWTNSAGQVLGSFQAGVLPSYDTNTRSMKLSKEFVDEVRQSINNLPPNETLTFELQYLDHQPNSPNFELIIGALDITGSVINQQSFLNSQVDLPNDISVSFVVPQNGKIILFAKLGTNSGVARIKNARLCVTADSCAGLHEVLAYLEWIGTPRQPVNFFNIGVRYTTRPSTGTAQGTANISEFHYPSLIGHLSSSGTLGDPSGPLGCTGDSKASCDYWKQNGNGGVVEASVFTQVYTESFLDGSLNPTSIVSTTVDLTNHRNWIWAIPNNQNGSIHDSIVMEFPSPALRVVESVEFYILINKLALTNAPTPVCPTTHQCGPDPGDAFNVILRYRNVNNVIRQFEYQVLLSTILENTSTSATQWDALTALESGIRGDTAKWIRIPFILDTRSGTGIDQCTTPQADTVTGTGTWVIQKPLFTNSNSYVIGACTAIVDVLELTQGSATNEIQSIIMPGPSGGTWTVSFTKGGVTDSVIIPWDALPGQLRSRLGGLSTIESQDNLNITGTGHPNDPYVIEFINDLGATNLNLLVADGSNLVGISPAFVTPLADGTRNERQTLTNLTGSTANFNIIVQGDISLGLLPFNASLNSVQNRLEGYFGVGNVLVTGMTVNRSNPYTGPWYIDFVGVYAGLNVQALGVMPATAYKFVTDWQGGSGTNERQQVTVIAATGTFTLTVVNPLNPTESYTTPPLQYNASAEQVRDALESASFPVDVDVLRLAATPGVPRRRDWVIEFVGTLGGVDVELLAIDGTNLRGGDDIIVTEEIAGAGNNERQRITIHNANGGSFRLKVLVDGVFYTSQAIPWNTTAQGLQAQLSNLEPFVGIDPLVVTQNNQPVPSSDTSITAQFVVVFKRRFGNVAEFIPIYEGTLVCDPIALVPVDPGPYQYPLEDCNDLADSCQSGHVLCRPVADTTIIDPVVCCDPESISGRITANRIVFERDLFDPNQKTTPATGTGRLMTIGDLARLKRLDRTKYRPYIRDFRTGELLETDYSAPVSTKMSIMLIENGLDTARGRERIIKQLREHREILPARMLWAT